MPAPTPNFVDPKDPGHVLSVGSRVQTAVGMVRHGTVTAIRLPRDPRDDALLTVRWDDTRNELCTGVRSSNVRASSAIDALAAVLDRPEPRPEPRRDCHHALDLVVHAGGQLSSAARLGLGFALMAGDDDLGAWW